MSRHLSSIGIRTAIFSLLALPLLALVGVGGWTASSSWRTASEMRELNILAELAPTISALVHELQQERGASAVYIGSGDEPVAAQRLADQRRLTDQRELALTRMLEAFDPAAYGKTFATRLRVARLTVAELDEDGGGRNEAGIEIVPSSSAWAFRIDVTVGRVARSWWSVYARRGSRNSRWECVQRLAILE